MHQRHDRHSDECIPGETSYRGDSDAQLLSGWRAIVATLVMAGCVWGAGPMIAGRSEALQLVIMIPIGGISYFGASFALWLASGRPVGPESEALDLLQFVRRRKWELNSDGD